MPQRKSFRTFVKKRVPLRRLFKRATSTGIKAQHFDCDQEVICRGNPENTHHERPIGLLQEKELCFEVNIDNTTPLLIKCVNPENASYNDTNKPDNIISSTEMSRADSANSTFKDSSRSLSLVGTVHNSNQPESRDDNETTNEPEKPQNCTETDFASCDDKENKTLNCHEDETNDNCDLNLSKESFELGDYVEVLRTHGKHAGKRGRVTKLTKKFVFFIEDGTDEKMIQISPKFLVDIEVFDSRDVNQVVVVRKSPSSQQIKTGDIVEVKTEYQIKKGDIVEVKTEHKKHGGKQGVVDKTTLKFATVIVGTTESFRIMKTSLVLLSLSKPLPPDCNSVSETECPNPPISSARSLKSKPSQTPNEPAKEKSSNFVHGLHSTTIKRAARSKVDTSHFPPRQQRLERSCFGTSHAKEMNLLKKMLTDDIMTFTYELPAKKLDPVKFIDGKRYELYYADVGNDPTKSSVYFKTKQVVAHYLQTENLRELEESLADFGSLKPRKVWARRRLFLSTAVTLKVGTCGISELTQADIAMHDNSCTVGCGFIDEALLEELLGNNVAARRAIGVQIRINVPTLGVFKGVLMRKRITNGPPIQLNDSLQKVFGSRNVDAMDSGHIIMKRVFPSNTNLQVARLFRHEKEMTKSFRKQVKLGKDCKLSKMYKNLMHGLGVPKEVLSHYEQSFKRDVQNCLCHTHLVGVADPTGSLPPNTVYMTGVDDGLDVGEVFIARSPSVEPGDGRVVKIISSKPATMSQEDWEWLNSLHFGAIIFANPKEGQRPLPEIIADGDLDGDLYFVCWDKKLLACINPLPITDDDLRLSSETEKEDGSSYDDDWFEKAQEFVCNIGSSVDVQALTGILYRKSEKIAKKKSIKHPDAVAYAKAYKQALEYKKHGRSIELPARLVHGIPAKYHCSLSPTTGDDY